MVDKNLDFNVSLDAIMANTNTVFKAISYNPTQKLTAYACANMVLIADTINSRRVYFSLNGHENRVNCVQWLDSTNLVSVSDRIVVYSGEIIDGAKW